MMACWSQHPTSKDESAEGLDTQLHPDEVLVSSRARDGVDLSPSLPLGVSHLVTEATQQTFRHAPIPLSLAGHAT